MLGNRETFPSKQYLDVADYMGFSGDDVRDIDFSLFPKEVVYSIYVFADRCFTGGGLPYFVLLTTMVLYFLFEFVAFVSTDLVGMIA